MDECDESMILDINQHVDPSLLASIETLILRRTWLKGDYGQRWMHAGPLQNVLKWLNERLDGGSPVKTLRFEECDPTLQDFSDHITGCEVVGEVIWN
jgi:hypothetical protein